MAVPGDYVYVRRLCERGVIAGDVLEIGSRKHQKTDWGNSQATIEAAGLIWQGADIEPGDGVTFTLDILDDRAVAELDRTWDAVLLVNLLEHVYDPIAAMRNALRLLAPGGALVVVGPAIWQLHDFPGDYWRPLPDFFIEFARRHELDADESLFDWIVHDTMVPMRSLTDGAGQKQLPSRILADTLYGHPKVLRSRIAHRMLRTFGRDMFFPYVGLGTCLRRPV